MFPEEKVDEERQQSIFDQTDHLLKQYYSFSDPELDFIINYDIKYRMGGELNDDE
jgi:hypothetical protein